MRMVMSLSQSHLTVFVLLLKFTAMAGISNSGSRNEYLAAGARLNLFSTNHSPIVKNSALASPTPRIPCQFSYHSIYVLLPWNEPPRVRIPFYSTRDTESSQALPSSRTFPRREKTLSTISPETDNRRSASLLSEMPSFSESPPSFLVFKGIELSKRIIQSSDRLITKSPIWGLNWRERLGLPFPNELNSALIAIGAPVGDPDRPIPVLTPKLNGFNESFA